MKDDYEDDDCYDHEDDYGEACGSCDNCSVNLYEDDCYVIGDEWLCGQCAWYAMGCPEPN